MLKDNEIRPQIEAWLLTQKKHQPALHLLGGWELTAIQGDAGFRRYFRLQGDAASLIAVYAPPEHEKNQAFIDIASFLLDHGVRVPKVVCQDFDQGFFLLEDLGESLFLDHLDADSVNTLYGEALFSLLRIQQSPRDRRVFPPYSEKLLLQEMQLFCDWFITRLLEYKLSDTEAAIVSKTFDMLVESAVCQPQVVVHRDFHSRNIVFSQACSPGIIDFQDAVIGPVTYDLVSLLKDCYICWPPQQVAQWALAYSGMATDVGIMKRVSTDQFLTWFDFMGLQRHLKVLGIFSRLWLRDGKRRYLADLPLVIHYVRECCRKYESTAEFADWFDGTILPLATAFTKS